jgi:hypothetical protein
MTDKFPEAFHRFTKVVSVRNIKSWKQLQLAFSSWSPKKWIPTSKQLDALAVQARKLGIETTEYQTRDEKVKAIFQTAKEKRIAIEQQKEAQREKGFSRSYSSLNAWMEKTTRTTAYQRRVISYIRNHPKANLEEARGHTTKRLS